MKSLRMLCSTGMDWFAHSMRFLPCSASSMFLMSHATGVAVLVAIMFSVFPVFRVCRESQCEFVIKGVQIFYLHSLSAPQVFVRLLVSSFRLDARSLTQV